MRGEQAEWPRFMTRIPPDLKSWLAQQAERYGTSQNSEIIRAIRERMERQAIPLPPSASATTQN